MSTIGWALLSTRDKTGLVEFVRIIASCGASLISTGGAEPKPIRAAAIHSRVVATVTHPADYSSLGRELAKNGALSAVTHWRLVQKAFEATAAFGRAASGTLPSLEPGQALRRPAADSLPVHLDLRVPC